MRTKEELFRDAQLQIAARRQRAVTDAETARRSAYAAHPELQAADDAHTHAGLALAKAAMGGNLPDALAQLAAADDAYKKALLAAGYNEDSFVPRYFCPVCEDTGMAQGKRCNCVIELARRLRREEINAASPLGLCKFDTFDVNRVPAVFDPNLNCTQREYMTKMYNYCQKYANEFSPQSISLLFMGGVGLGKTHLALAIADTVLDRGYDVLYASSAALSAQLNREHFDHEGSDLWLNACKEADLLILDDLGTEYINSLTISVLYELINTRMLTHRPTIYTTNIVEQRILESRYTEKVASRMLGGCKKLPFTGTDQRSRKAGK